MDDDRLAPRALGAIGKPRDDLIVAADHFFAEEHPAIEVREVLHRGLAVARRRDDRRTAVRGRPRHRRGIEQLESTRCRERIEALARESHGALAVDAGAKQVDVVTRDRRRDVDEVAMERATASKRWSIW